jgi:hypothetical protein
VPTQVLRLPAVVLVAALVVTATHETPEVTRAAPLTFHCSLDPSCPEILVNGDPYATIGGNPSPFRGYGDPSLERDPDTGTLWLSYSWLNVLVTNPGPSQLVDFGVETHLARSDDGGGSFDFVESVNQMTAVTHPDTAASGWESHEVSTLLNEGAGSWQMMWLSYFDPPGATPFFDVRYERALGASPDAVGVPVEWARGNATSAAWGSQHNLSAIPQLADCVAFTEPALFAQDGITYLATNCVVFSGGVRQDAQERLVLLRQEANGYSFVGNLLDGQDAVDVGGTRIEQADIALSQTGEILLIATPIQSAEPNHLGCVVYEIADITTAAVLRDAGGEAVQLAQISGDDNTIGPGLCAYDGASETGVLMVQHILKPSPFDMEFSMRATGLHPMDTDGDGVENTMDVDDDGDGYSDYAEGFITTTPLDGCGAGVGPDPSTAWPADFASGGIPDSTDRVTITDLVSFLAPIRRFGTSPLDWEYYDPRWDLVPGPYPFGEWINILDLTNLIIVSPPMLGGVRAFNGPVCSG